MINPPGPNFANKDYVKVFDCLPGLSFASALYHIYKAVQEKNNNQPEPKPLKGYQVKPLNKEWGHGVKAFFASIPFFGNLVLAIYYLSRKKEEPIQQDPVLNDDERVFEVADDHPKLKDKDKGKEEPKEEPIFDVSHKLVNKGDVDEFIKENPKVKIQERPKPEVVENPAEVPDNNLLIVSIDEKGPKAHLKNDYKKLTTEQKNALKNKEIWAKPNGWEVRCEHINKILGKNASGWLDGEGIHEYLEVLQIHLNNKGNKKTKFIKNQFIAILEQKDPTKRERIFLQRICGENIDLGNQNDLIDNRRVNYAEMSPFKTKKMNEYDKVLFPLHAHGNHWILCEIDINAGKIKFYNSLAKGNAYDDYINDAFNEIGGLLNKYAEKLKIPKKDWEKIVNEGKKPDEYPQQRNGSDCGVFVCKYAEKIALNIPITKNDPDFANTQVNGPVREQIAARVMSGKL